MTSSSAPVVPATSSDSGVAVNGGAGSRRLCPVCGKPGTKVCAGCSKVAYCSKEHQREHWKEHKLVCAQKVTAAPTSTCLCTTPPQRPPPLTPI